MQKHKTKIIFLIVIIISLMSAWALGGSPGYDGGDMFLPDLTETELVYMPPDLSQNNENYAQSHHSADTVLSADKAIESCIYGNQYEIADQVRNDKIQEQTDCDYMADSIHASDAMPSDEPITIICSYTDISSDSHDTAFYITLSVTAETLLNNMHLLGREKHELIPEDGIIFPASIVRVYAGESVFNVLQREMRYARIHMAARFTPIFDSAYVEAINNIYEFDAGPLSGWMYRVNGVFPNFGSSGYILSPGDIVEWLYTVDLGRDIGGERWR